MTFSAYQGQVQPYVGKTEKGKMNPQEENPRELLGGHHHMAMPYHPLSLEMPAWPAYRYPVREIAREAASRFLTSFDERRQILRNQYVESPFCDCLEKKAYASCHCGEEDTGSPALMLLIITCINPILILFIC